MDPFPSETTSSNTNTKRPALPLTSESKYTPLNSISTLEHSAPVADVMDALLPTTESAPSPQAGPEVPAYPAPLPDSFTTSAQNKVDMMAKEANEEEVTEEETAVEEADASLDTSSVQPSSTNGVAEVELEGPSITLPPCHLEDPLVSPIAQPEELRLPNGLPLPAPRDPNAPAINTLEHDDSPIAEPDVSQQPDTLTSTAEAATQRVPASTVPADQPAPAHTVDEVPVKEAVQTEPAQPEAKDTVQPVLDDKENAPEPQSDTREETSSPAEPVSTADNVPETMPASPPPAGEEKEDPLSTQTVTPPLVETIMQGQSLSVCL